MQISVYHAVVWLHKIICRAGAVLNALEVYILENIEAVVAKSDYDVGSIFQTACGGRIERVL